MSDNLEALLAEGDNDTDLVKNLRKALREANTKKGELERTLNDRVKADRTRSLADVLKEKGVPEKAARYFPADVDPTPEAVEKWLDEDGDLFGYVKQESTATDEIQAAAALITGASAGAPSGTQTMDIGALMAEMRNASDPEALAKVYEKAGMKLPNS